MNYNKGAQAERRLIKKLIEKGFTCIRVAGSGRARTEQPDIIASNGTRIIAFECKRTVKKSVYIPKEEIEDLKKFSKGFKCEAVIAANIGRKWYFWDAYSIKKTQNKNYCFSAENGNKNF